MKLLASTALALALVGGTSVTAIAVPQGLVPQPPDSSESVTGASPGAVTVYTSVNGKGEPHSVPAGTTVATLLKSLSVTPKPTDRLSAPLTSKLTDKQLLVLTSAQVVSYSKPLALPFTQVKAAPVSCPKAGSKVLQQGVVGSAQELWQDTFYNTVKSGSKKVGVKTVKAPVNQVTAPCVVPAPVKVTPPPVKLVTPAPTATTPSPTSTATPTPSASSLPFTGASTTPTTSGSGSTPTTSGGLMDSSYYANLYFSGGNNSVTLPSTVTPSVPTYQAGGTKEQWMAAAGIPQNDWPYVDYIVSRESSWNPTAVNSSSGACGLVQALPCSKLGPNWSDPVTALKWQAIYVQKAYGGYPQAAAFWRAHNWY